MESNVAGQIREYLEGREEYDLLADDAHEWAFLGEENDGPNEIRWDAETCQLYFEALYVLDEFLPEELDKLKRLMDEIQLFRTRMAQIAAERYSEFSNSDGLLSDNFSHRAIETLKDCIQFLKVFRDNRSEVRREIWGETVQKPSQD